MMEAPMTQDFDLAVIPPDQPDFDPAAIEDFGPAPVAITRRSDDRLDAVHDVPVKVQAVLGRSRMPIGDLLRLKAGMVVELDRRVGEPVDVFVNNRLIARGEVVMIDDMLGVTLTEIVRHDR